MLTVFLSISLAFSPLMKSVTIGSSGKISVRILFNNCDQIGDWKVTSPSENILEVDTEDKVEGTASLKGTFAVTDPNWGGMFYKAGLWNFSKTPLMWIWMKLNTSISGLKFELVTSPGWDGFQYEILDQLAVGEWREVVIDLRLPDYGPSGKLPNLAAARQIGFFTWDRITEPSSLSWDYITLESGPYIPPQTTITPQSATVMENESLTFTVNVLGGEPPYSFAWYVNDTLQEETLDSFIFMSDEAGNYTIRCVVSDNQGNSSSSTATVTVLAPPPPQPPIPPSLDIFKSEVRAVSVAYVWSDSYNHSLIAQTLFDYGINTAYVDIDKAYFIGYDMEWNGSLRDLTYHRIFIDECHKRGIRVIASFVTTHKAPSNMRTLTSTGEADWLDVTKPEAQEMLKAMVQALARDYDFDCINFDYIRWMDQTDMPFGDEAKTKFIADTGLDDVIWFSDVQEGGRYYWDFLNWRADVITELVGNLTRWIKEINPNIIIAITPWRILPDAPYYWVKAIGLRAADMVDKGYADYVSPMIYEADPAVAANELNASLEFLTGGVEGKVPMIPWVNYLIGTPSDLVQKLTAMKNVGIDGWILNPYGGPGAESLEYSDIRPYLTALREAGLMEPVWAIQNFSVVISGNTATISWTTTVPTISRIEYADHPLFEAEEKYFQGLYYKDINYVNGTIQEDTTPKTEHSFTIPITNQTRFRIQSIDSNNVTMTSKPISILEKPH